MGKVEPLDYRAKAWVFADMGEEFGENGAVRYCDMAIERIDGGDMNSTRRQEAADQVHVPRRVARGLNVHGKLGDDFI